MADIRGTFPAVHHAGSHVGHSEPEARVGYLSLHCWWDPSQLKTLLETKRDPEVSHKWQAGWIQISDMLYSVLFFSHVEELSTM